MISTDSVRLEVLHIMPATDINPCQVRILAGSQCLFSPPSFNSANKIHLSNGPDASKQRYVWKPCDSTSLCHLHMYSYMQECVHSLTIRQLGTNREI